MEKYLSIVLALAFLFCAGDVCASEAETSKKAASTSKVGAFPITFEVRGSTYTITGYSLGKNDEGNTIVTIHGDGLATFTMSGVDFSKPLQFKPAAKCEFESAGKTYAWTSSTIGDSWIYEFDTSITPEKIILKNDETGESILSFNVKNEPPQK